MMARLNGSSGLMTVAAVVAAVSAATVVHVNVAVAQDRKAGRASDARIVSLNLCTDQLVVALVDRARIAGVTALATDGQSTPEPERAAGLPVTTADAEDVLRRRPDLVLASPFTPDATLSLLRRTGLRVETVGAAQTIAGVREALLKTARATGDDVRGAALVAAIDAAVVRNAPLPAENNTAKLRRPSALVMQPNSYVSGAGSLVSELLAAAGFDNHASRLGVGEGGRVDIEAVIVTPPDVLVLASEPGEYATVVSDNLRHPAMIDLARRVPSAVIPWSGWLCGTHHIVGVLDSLGTLRRRWMATGGGRS